METAMPRSLTVRSIIAVSTLFSWFALIGCGASAEESDTSLTTITAAVSARTASHVPPLPDPSLTVPAGNKLAFHFDAVGAQIYACQTTATGTVAWVFQAPEATLFGRRGKIAGKHFAGPTWQTNDGSLVVGAKVAAFVVDPTAIPWLLLQAVSHQGDGRMEEVTFIQRLETIGGIAPTTGCDADHLGAVARIGYSATYFFYEAKDADEGDRD
jgi:hypothetical protein